MMLNLLFISSRIRLLEEEKLRLLVTLLLKKILRKKLKEQKKN